jgi:signal transduction histidine kinase
MFTTVRDLALGLRPSMLDDLGLQPALEWHVRDFIQRYDVNVELSVSGDLDVLPDRHRTCIYRAVQEALTNCVRHAQAQVIHVVVARRGERVGVSIRDDGAGFDTGRREGLGLRGIEERVRELDGVMSLSSAPGDGTTVSIDLPLPAGERTDDLARAAG